MTGNGVSTHNICFWWIMVDNTAHAMDENGWRVPGTIFKFTDHTSDDLFEGFFFYLFKLLVKNKKTKMYFFFCLTENMLSVFLWWNHASRQRL